MPAPCNESYVSFACVNSTTGIVHEGAEKWLGALLTSHPAEPPPIPTQWLQIHGLSANASQQNYYVAQ